MSKRDDWVGKVVLVTGGLGSVRKLAPDYRGWGWLSQ
jgi:hypothetical protein